MSNYKPTEHGGFREDGKPDHRVADPPTTTATGGSLPGEFAHGKVDPSKAGHLGGLAASGQDISGSSSTSSGNNSTGNSGGSAPGEFAHGKVDPSKAGHLGGLAASGQDISGSSGAGSGDANAFAHGKVDPAEAGRKGGQAS